MNRIRIPRCAEMGVVVLAMCAGVMASALANSDLRDGVPVVLVGAQIPWEHVSPSDVVAFSYRGGWTQIPVQIDERDVAEYARIYGFPGGDVVSRGGFGENVYGEVYCDPNTSSGSDSDVSFDANDELVFMLQDAGDRAPGNKLPEFINPQSGIELTLNDRLSGDTFYVYLFLQSGTLDSGAGVSYVDYDFKLLSGAYKATYNTTGVDEDTGLRNSDHGPQLNPENSIVRTSSYERHWSYRWTCDQLSLFGGSNLVEREDYWIAPGSCGRHNGTFNAQEGAIIANISGPVRAIRSVIGANSGPLVQLDRIFYAVREDTALYLRVHPRSSVGIFYVDHTHEAVGMTYYNDLNPNGVTIDGRSDRLALGPIRWELVTGDPGSIVRIHNIDTDIDFSEDDFTLFYADDLDTEITLCEACTSGCRVSEPLGDAHLIGASGIWNTAQQPNTDPGLLATNYLTMLTSTYYGTPNWTAEDAGLRREWSDNPIVINTVPWREPDD
ncbi:hypothetical protein ACFLSW_00605 [Candidatus Bipolaricaulota bacterium]